MDISLRNFDKGLHLTQPEDAIPQDALRRARGVARVRMGSLRTRPGSALIDSLASVHSIRRFNDDWYYGAGTAFYQGTTSKKTGLDGSRLSFARLSPTAGATHQLMCCGGGELFKIDTDGTVTNWGIEPPDDGTIAAAKTAATPKTVEIDDFDGTPATDWTGTDCTLANEATVKKEGTHSLKITITGQQKAYVTRDMSLDLSQFAAAGDMAAQDYIKFYLWIGDYSSLKRFYLQFSFGDTNYNDTATVEIRNLNYPVYMTGGGTSWSEIRANTIEARKSGMGSQTLLRLLEYQREVKAAYSESLTYTGGRGESRVNNETEQTALLQHTNAGTLRRIDDSWHEITVSKSMFTVSGTADWDDVDSVRFIIETTDDLIVRLDGAEASGGYGIQGHYKYLFTYYNSSTGTRSNPNDTPVEVDDLERGGVTLTNLPESTDSQVDKLEIWRTMGDGVLFFKVTDVDNGTTTFADDYADMITMDSRSDANVLSSTELSYYNIKPYDYFTDCYGPHNASVFWITSSEAGQRGRLFYSPIGRTEAMEGYIELCSDAEPCQRIASYAGALFVFTEARVFEIAGTNPYVSQELFGVPGTLRPWTVVTTPAGICYQSQDGIRILTTSGSKLLGYDQLARLYEEGVENLSQFNGLVATYARNEYIVSDGSQTLAFDFTKLAWRDLGLAITALEYAKDADELAAALASAVVDLENVAEVDDNGTARELDVETYTLRVSKDKEFTVQTLFIDWDLDGDTVSIYAIIDGTETLIGTATGTVRETTVIPIMRSCTRFAVRLTGSLDTGRPEIYGIDIEAEMPAEFTGAGQQG